MKRVFDVTFNGEERFETIPMTKAEAINMCKDSLIQNNMRNASYVIGYYENGEYTLIAIASRKRRANNRVSFKVVEF